MAVVTLDPQTYCGCTHPWTYHVSTQGFYRCTGVTKHGYRSKREFCTCAQFPPLPKEGAS